MYFANFKWQRGTYHKFYALMKIRVGAADPKSIPIDIQEGDEFEYDGQLLKYAGSEIHSPQLRGAIKNGWVTTDSDGTGTGQVATVQPSRDIAKSQTINRDLSRVQRGDHRPLDTDSLDEETVLNVSDRRPDSTNNPRARPQVLESKNNRRASTAGMRVDNSEHEEQDAVTIGRVRSPATLKVDNVLDSRASGMAKDIENRGLGKPEIFSRESTTEGVTIKTNVSQVDRNVRASQDDGGEVVGKVRHSKASSSDGVSVTDTSNIRNESAKVTTKADPKAALEKARKIDTSLPPKIRMARRIDPDFPSDWIFQGKLKDRMAAVEAYGATPQFLEALYAAEGDQMRKMLEQTFPKQFGG